MKRALAFVAALLVAACQDLSHPTGPDRSGLVGGAAATTAEVEFGSDAVGTSFPPAEHDQSFHAFDRMRPVTVVIARGGSVTYEIDECHQPAIYAPGTTPDDIDVNQTEPIGLDECPPDRITDANGRIALAPAQTEDEKEWTTPAGTFDQPGRYLVICTTKIHFVFAKMYGWVIVK
jgi:hypothetical protein